MDAPLTTEGTAVKLSVRRPSTATTDALLDHLVRWQPAFDALQTNVFVADLGLVIRFANATAQRTLRNLEPELRAAFGIGADQIVGGSIHRFHRDPHRVETILHQEQQMRLPHTARFTFGAATLDTKINELTDASGTALGYVVNWEDVSQLSENHRTFRDLGEQLGSSAAAVEELSASIGEISHASANAAVVSQRGVTAAEEARARVDQLDAASRQITDIVSVITSIAEQTNLLALNATIEAARVGELGKGFAVVAGEVKDLARSTAEATGGITAQVQQIQAQVALVTATIGEVSATISEIEEHQTSIATAVEEQSAVVGDLSSALSRSVTASQDAISRLAY